MKKIPLLCGIFLLFLSMTAKAETYECSSCSDCSYYLQDGNMNDGDILILNSSINTSEINYYDNCIVFEESNVIFDCNGNVITGISKSIYYGIYVKPNSNNNTIKNCKINNFENAIFLENNSNNIIRNLTDSELNYNGIKLKDSINNTIIDSQTNYEEYGIYLYSGSNNVFMNIESNYNNQFGIYFKENCHNNTVINATINNNYNRGIRIEADNNSYNIFKNIISNNNHEIGISIYTSQNSVLENITTVGNTQYGVSLISSPNTSLNKINANFNGIVGILIIDSPYTVLNNSNLSYNNQYGIYLSNNYATITDSVINSNNYGIYIEENSNNNIIKNSKIENNTYGIYFSSASENDITYNEFYNNYIKNTNNFDWTYTNIQNYWNTSKTLGKNIVNGIYLGGNYWSNPSGTGYSDICNDSNNDGICDEEFEIMTGMKDYLPLTSYQYTLDISWNSPSNNSLTNNKSSILWNATISQIPYTCILEINGTSNYSMLISGNYCYYTTTNLSNQTTYCGVIYANGEISNISTMQCATVNLSENIVPQPRPIDNLGIFGGVILLSMGAGVILFILKLLFSDAPLSLTNLSELIGGIIGVIIIISMIAVLL